MTTFSELQTKIGSELGVSDWHLVDQGRISGFADVTEDHQFIHTEPERAKGTPLGGVIAHGFLTLSLLSVFFAEVVGEIEGTSMSMNYGFDAVRMLSPVPVGNRVRGRFLLEKCTERRPGQWQLSFTASVEIENHEKPALVASWLVLVWLGT
ncbi:MaoC family dehydratase [Martelella sp. AMO21009]